MTALTRLDAMTWLAGRDEITVVALNDPVVEALGHDPRSAYAEAYWLPILGPSSLLAARWLAAGLEQTPKGFCVPLAPFAAQLGLGRAIGRQSPAVRTLARLVAFDMAGVRGDRYAMRRAFGPLTRRQIAQLPAHLAELHRREVESRHPATSPHNRSTGNVIPLRALT